MDSEHTALDYLARGRELSQLIETSEQLHDHYVKINQALNGSSTGNELIFKLRFACARLVTLEAGLPDEILLAARQLFKQLDEIVESNNGLDSTA